jgi:hypothetical protein
MLWIWIICFSNIGRFPVSAAYVRDNCLCGLLLTHPQIAGAKCGENLRMAEWTVTDCRQELVLRLGDCAFSVMKFDMSRVLSRQIRWIGPVLGFVAYVDEPRFRKGNFLSFFSASGQGPVSPACECHRLCVRLPRTVSSCCCSYILMGGIHFTSLLRSVLRVARLLILHLLGYRIGAWYLGSSHDQS